MSCPGRIAKICAALSVRLSFVVAALALACCRVAIGAEDASSLELAVKATYLYKFEPFVTWPDQAFASPNSPFTLCIVGTDPFGPLIDEAVKGQRIGEHEIMVSRLREASPDAHCNIMYIAASDAQWMLRQLTAVRGQPVLTITDAMGAAERKGIINFIILDNRVRFEIDENAAALSGLSISSKLLGIAASVKPRS